MALNATTATFSHTAVSALRMALRAMRRHPLLGAVFLVAAASQGLLQGVFLWVLRDVLLAFDETAVSMEALTWGAATIGGIWILRSLFTYAGESAKYHLAHKAEIDGVQRVLGKLLRVPIRYFERSSEGDVILASYYDLAGIRVVIQQVGTVLITLSRLAGLAVVAWMISPSLATIGFVAIPLGSLPVYWMGRRMTRVSRRHRAKVVALHDVFLQLASGIRVIRVNRAEARVEENAGRIAGDLYRTEVRRAELKHAARLILEIVSGVGLILVLVIGGRDVAAGALDWQALLALLVAMMAVYTPVVSLLTVYSEIRMVIPRLDRTEAMFGLPEEPPDAPGARPLTDAPKTIELQDVSFSYDGRDLALDSVSIAINRGETVGLVGPSGAGKSTLVALLMRLYEPTGGRILYDGVDIRDLRRADILDRSAIVLQEPFLFTDTVANNIRWARPGASMDEVIAAAKAAYIHDEIMQMPEGYETVVGRGETGRGVSVGQKQRICIAAALLKDAPLLFMDEATSSLDSASERAVQAAVERLMEGRTTIVIAHRLSTVQRADRIVVLERGRVVGVGTHEELLKTCPTYQLPWQYQTSVNEWGRAAGAASGPAADEASRLAEESISL